MLGDAAEWYFMGKAAALGLILSKPMQLKAAYDVMVEAGRKFFGVQVKSHISAFTITLPLSDDPAQSEGAQLHGGRDRFRRGIRVSGGRVVHHPDRRSGGKAGDRRASGDAAGGRFERFRARWDLLLGGSPENRLRRDGGPVGSGSGTWKPIHHVWCGSGQRCCAVRESELKQLRAARKLLRVRAIVG